MKVESYSAPRQYRPPQLRSEALTPTLLGCTPGHPKSCPPQGSFPGRCCINNCGASADCVPP